MSEALITKQLICKKITTYGIDLLELATVLKPCFDMKISTEDAAILTACISRLQNSTMNDDQFRLFKQFMKAKFNLDIILQ